MNSPAPHDIVNVTLESFRGLKGLPSLAPDELTNRMFSNLVATAMVPMRQTKAETLLAEIDGEIGLGSLHMLCAEGEFAMEQHWADRIKNATNPKKELRTFPYWSNYLKLAALEVKAMRALAPDAKKVLFVGAGPLPLTAYIFAAHYGLNVTNLEVEETAACCALAWMEPILGVGHIPCVHTDVMDFTDFGEYDVIVLAALVGLTQAEKHRIVAHLHTHLRPDQLLMVRSVRGLRKLLYPTVQAADLQGFDVVKEVHPRGEVVNSVVLARKTGL